MTVTTDEIFFTKLGESTKSTHNIPLDQIEKAELCSENEKLSTTDSKMNFGVNYQRRDSKASSNQDKDKSPKPRELSRTGTISSFQHFHGVRIITKTDGELCGRIYDIHAVSKAHSFDIVKTLQKYSERAKARAEHRGRFEMSQIYLREVLDHQYFRAFVVFLILAVIRSTKRSTLCSPLTLFPCRTFLKTFISPKQSNPLSLTT